jgi:copper transport protein
VRLLALPAALLAVLAWAATAYGHAAYVGSEPTPGQRLETSPPRIVLVFTEPLNGRLARATVRPAGGGPPVPASVRVDRDRKRLVVTPARELATGAYRVDWHTVSTEDGHALEGAFSFGVRADAGAAPALETGPLARWGVVRIAARIALYATVLVLAAALLLPLLIGRPRGWPVPELDPGDAGGRVDLADVRARERRLRGDLAWAAVAAAVVATIADAADAARGLDHGRMGDYLAGNLAGIGRALVVLALLAAALLRDRRPRAAAAAAVLALGAVAASGHAGSADPRVPSILNDWLHLVAGALWLGGIALLVLLWWPVVRFTRRGSRVAIAREVLAPFGRVAVGAFLVAVTTGLVSLVTQLGRVAALWETAYGRLLAVKIAVVGMIAVASFVHARRLRPRLLYGDEGEALERRHWTLWRSEPWLGLAVIAAVAGLVAFPLPPRQLDQAGRAQAAVCDPCPLPRPSAEELGVATDAGSNVVAGWIRRGDDAVTGTVRVLDRDGDPAKLPVELPRARVTSCGDGCRRFRLPASAREVEVAVRERGRRYATALPAVWERRGNRRARALLRRAEATMRALPGVRELERLSSGPGTGATTQYRLRAPDRLAWETGRGVRSVVIGRRQWVRQPGLGWREGDYGSGLAFKTRSWFAWSRYAREVRVLSERGGRAVIALADEGTPVWFRLTVDLDTHRVLAEQMTARARFIDTRFTDFGERFRIEAPR